MTRQKGIDYGYQLFHLYQHIHLGIPDPRYIYNLYHAMNQDQRKMWEYMAEQFIQLYDRKFMQ